MPPIRTPHPVALTMALLIALGIGAAAAATSREDTLAVLDGLAAGDPDAGFEARVADGNGGAYRVGDPIHFELSTREPMHALLFYLDSYGVATLFFVRGTGPSGALEPGRRISVPTPDDGFSLEVSPPVGRESLVFVATPTPLDPEVFGLEAGARISDPADPERATALARRLAEELTAIGPERTAIVRLDQRIVGGTDELEYTTREIVDHFRATRSLKRPRLPMHLNFDTDSAELTPEIRLNLDEMGKAMQHPSLEGQRILIGGHTDDLGDPDYNLALSERRAEAVRSYLLEHYAIAPERIDVRAYGESAPLEPGASAEARAMNRRVEFELGP